MEEMLRREGYAVRSFPRGRMALASASELPPDLVLLDINMPEMDGFDVCERLKADPKLASIPVIFLSAVVETEEKVRAFHSGAVDYVTKPFQVDEVRARVRTQLQLHRLQARLQHYNAELEDTVASRTGELMKAQDRLRVLDDAKSDFLRLISHELRTPLNGLLGVSELVIGDLPVGTEQDELRAMFDQSRERLLSLMDAALLLTEIHVDGDRFSSTAISVDAMMDRSMRAASRLADLKQVRIERQASIHETIHGNEDLIVRAIDGLLRTAVKFSGPGQVVTVGYRHGEDSLQILIETAGGRVSKELLPRFFDSFSVDETLTGGIDVGLELSVAKRIVGLFKGSVTARNRDISGIQLTASFHRPGG